MKGIIQKRVFGDTVVNGGTGGKAQIQNDAALTVIFRDSLQRLGLKRRRERVVEKWSSGSPMGNFSCDEGVDSIWEMDCEGVVRLGRCRNRT